MKCRKQWILAMVIILGCGIHKTNGVFLLTSLMMAVNGGIAMSTMTLGGLMLMLMSATQNQRSGNSDGILSWLQQLGASGGQIYTPKDGNIVKRMGRVYENETADDNETTEQLKVEVSKRMIRQISSFDPLSCLPKLACSISAKPPSDQTSLLNDYAHLLKETLIGTTDEEEEEEEEDLRTNIKKRKHETSEDDEEDDVINTLLKKEEYEIEQLANEQMIDENPSFLPFALIDSYRNKPPKFKEKYTLRKSHPSKTAHHQANKYDSEDPVDITDEYLDHFSTLELQNILSKLESTKPTKPGGLSALLMKPNPHIKDEKDSSLLSKFLPKISIGMSPFSSSSGSFDGDPFFDGFKRSLQSAKLKKIPEDEMKREFIRTKKSLVFKIQNKIEDKNYMDRMKRELKQIQEDPLEVYKLALKVGNDTRSARQCRMLFDGCPFKYNEVLKMIGGLRQAISGRPQVLAAASSPSTVPVSQPTKAAASANLKSPSSITVNTGSTSTGTNGVTSILHQLPNGEKVEINLMGSTTGNGKQTAVSQDESIESLKATILAIQRINEAAKLPNVSLSTQIGSSTQDTVPQATDKQASMFQNLFEPTLFPTTLPTSTESQKTVPVFPNAPQTAQAQAQAQVVDDELLNDVPIETLNTLLQLGPKNSGSKKKNLSSKKHLKKHKQEEQVYESSESGEYYDQDDSSASDEEPHYDYFRPYEYYQESSSSSEERSIRNLKTPESTPDLSSAKNQKSHKPTQISLPQILNIRK